MTTKKPEDTNKPRLRILRMPAVEDRTALGKTQIQELEARGDFPQRVKISKRAIGYYEHEIDAWIEQLPRVQSPRHA